MSTFKEHLSAYANSELELAGFDQTEFGKTSLKLLDNLADLTNGDPDTMKQLCSLLPRLIDQLPIAPITEADFAPEYHSQGDNTVTIYRCTRYSWVYRTEDGKYWDDRAVAFKFVDSADADRMYIYQSGNSSKQEVTLPYYPEFKVEIISRDFNIEPDYEVE